jgi:hypothetical protein
MSQAIPLAIDMFVSFDQSDEGVNLGLDLKVRFEGGEYYIDDAIVTEPATGIYSARKEVAPNWLYRLIEADAGVRAAAEKVWSDHQEYLVGQAADGRREERRLSA